MYTISFYAYRRGYYHNKLFSFNVKKEIEIGNLLLAFALEGNHFYSIYVTDHFTQENNRLTYLQSIELIRTSAMLKGCASPV